MPTFNDNPILNSPWEAPSRHWLLDEKGRPVGKSDIKEGRRDSHYLVPVPAAKSTKTRGRGGDQTALMLAEEEDSGGEKYENALVNDIRVHIKKWRELPPDKWRVSPVTRELLLHWREKKMEPPLFFCQLEAAETLIYLNEVAPHFEQGRALLRDIAAHNKKANPELFRLAAKMATGAGKTTVMAMLIAYHALNKIRAPRSEKFSRAFLVVTPGITIRDRLRVLLPHDPENYYKKRGIVPPDMLADIQKAKVVIQNYHAFGARNNPNLPKMTAAAKAILRGNLPPEELPPEKETEEQILRRACGKDFLREKDAVVINDEAHHCFQVAPSAEESKAKKKGRSSPRLSAEEKKEIAESRKAARVWISGLKALAKKVSLRAVYDLSATPFFLKGSGFPPATLFPWVVSDFSLVEAIESGIVKMPRVPVEDAAPGDMPVFRDIYRRVYKFLPRKGAKKQGVMDPSRVPTELTGALKALYDHYEKAFSQWKNSGIQTPPVFIVVCNNTSSSKLVYDYLAGWQLPSGVWRGGEMPLFSNVGEDGRPLARPRTLLIDSHQLESGEALSKEFKEAAAEEIKIFQNDIRVRDPGRDVEKISDSDLLREVMNTVGKKDKLGEQIRCVVSVSMLTEGWDASNVTHILGVRAFGSQLLCEQVVGRALRRLNYEPDKNTGMLKPDYADVFGVPFVFAATGKAVPAPPAPRTRVCRLSERRRLAIHFPRVRGYKTVPPQSRLRAVFDENSDMMIDAETAPPKTMQAGIVGEVEMITLDSLKQRRRKQVVYRLAAWTAQKYYREKNGDGNVAVAPSRFADLVAIVDRWIDGHLICKDGTFLQYLLWERLADRAAKRIHLACSVSEGKESLLPVMDPFNPKGSTDYVDFLTSKSEFLLHKTAEDKSHINIASCDSNWEMNFCKILESEPAVAAYARNVGMGFEIPYEDDNRTERMYRPDFVVKINDRNDPEDMLHLAVEVKGYKDGDAQAKAGTASRRWVPAVNNDGRWGRWAFLEIMDMQNARTRLAKFTRPPIVGGGKHHTNAERSVSQ